tara:strand:- start:441 stop:839 length:399 start_codon:yes stop_codon:yes gene_type:complete
MATNAQWTVVFDDKVIINHAVKNSANFSTAYFLTDSSYDSFWSDAKWSNVWAIQYKDDDHDYNDTVEFRDETPHKTWTQANLGDFRTQFVSKWDAAHLAQLQSDWDNNNVDGETSEEKVTRLGARPTSYSSY